MRAFAENHKRGFRWMRTHTPRQRLGQGKRRHLLPLYFMMIPGGIYLIINNYIPMTGIVMAFKRYNYKTGVYMSPNVEIGRAHV